MAKKVEKNDIGTYQVCHQVDYTDAVSYRLSEKMSRSDAITTAWRDRSVVMIVDEQKMIIWHAPGVWPVWPSEGGWLAAASHGPCRTWRWDDTPVKHTPRVTLVKHPPTQYCAICASPLLTDGYHALFLGRICDACEDATKRTKLTMAQFYAEDNRRWSAWLKKWNKLMERLNADSSKRLVLR